MLSRFTPSEESTDGGASWSVPVQLAGPMELRWLANTNQGRMMGEYMDVGFAGGRAFPIFSVANAPLGATFDQSIATRRRGDLPCIYLPLLEHTCL